MEDGMGEGRKDGMQDGMGERIHCVVCIARCTARTWEARDNNFTYAHHLDRERQELTMPSRPNQKNRSLAVI